MNAAQQLYKLWLLIRFRNRDFAEIYSMLRPLLKNNRELIFKIVDDRRKNVLTVSPQYDDGYIFDDGVHKIFAATGCKSHTIYLPFQNGESYYGYTHYDIEISYPRGELLAGDKKCNGYFASYRRNMPKKLFKLMKKYTPVQNKIHGVIAQYRLK